MTTATSFVNDFNNALDILNRKYTIQGNLKNLKIVAREFRPYGFTYLRFEEVLYYLSKHGFLKLKYTYTDHMMQIGAWGQVEIDEGTYDLGVDHERQSYLILDLANDFKQKYEDYSERKDLKVAPEKGQAISTLEIVEPNEAISYFLVVNQDYGNPFRLSKKVKAWNLLLQIARGENIRINDLNKNWQYYLNSHNGNQLYADGVYAKSTILTLENSIFKAAVPLKIIGSKFYKSKINKLKPT